MERITTAWYGLVEPVPCNTAMNTLNKYVTSTNVEVTYKAVVKHGFVVEAQADNLPSITMYVTIETMKKLLDANLITYIDTEYDKTYEEQCMEMEQHSEYPQDGKLYWYTRYDNSWEAVTPWEEVKAWITEYRAQVIGEGDISAEMLPHIVAYASGYEVLAGVAWIEGKYLTMETILNMVEELGTGVLEVCETGEYLAKLIAKRGGK